ncbi:MULTISPECIES: DUF2500 domain-containing protein [Paenibacillus]|uniref:DUF2500 domain-containing protein n=1 Tax=Paenibacillus TaxID=44249 RepID=UPI0022B8AE09|nr:DUF2500 domain-containing protein [Paenibacillus caseinilyticus]MCZ8523449.1 DUF2500 domain-containing protein [Paenibacillus caseinilyticus]
MSPSPFGLFETAPPWFTFIFLAIAGMILFSLLRALTRSVSAWSANNAAERLTRQASVVIKRAQVSGGSGDTRASTWYYVTFELSESGDRVEMPVSGSEFGMLVEGDQGQLTYQGTRFYDFMRRSRSDVRAR